MPTVVVELTIDKNFVIFLIRSLSSLQVSLGERTASGTSMREAMWLFAVTSRSLPLIYIISLTCTLYKPPIVIFRLTAPPSFIGMILIFWQYTFYDVELILVVFVSDNLYLVSLRQSVFYIIQAICIL